MVFQEGRIGQEAGRQFDFLVMILLETALNGMVFPLFKEETGDVAFYNYHKVAYFAFCIQQILPEFVYLNKQYGRFAF